MREREGLAVAPFDRLRGFTPFDAPTRGRTPLATPTRGHATPAAPIPPCTRTRFRGCVAAFPLRRVGAKNRCTRVLDNGVSRARYYKPETGRFWTMDTFDGHSEDPLSLHKYLYCRNSPIDRIDPSGNEDLGGLMVNMTARAMAAANFVMRATSAVNWRLAYTVFRIQQNLWKVEVALAGLNLFAAGAEWIDSAAKASMNNTEVCTAVDAGPLFERVAGANATQYEAIDHVISEPNGQKSVVQLTVRSDTPMMTDDAFINKLGTTLRSKAVRLNSLRSFEPRTPGAAPVLQGSQVASRTVLAAIPETRAYLISDSRLIAMIAQVEQEYPMVRSAVTVLRSWRPGR